MSDKRIYYTPEMIMASDFYQFPKWLINVPISNDSKVLYMLLLDKYKLSLKNQWIDDENRIYLIISRENAAKLLNVGREKAIDLFKQLKGIGLLEEKRLGQGKTNWIYLKSVDYEEFIQKSEKQTSGELDGGDIYQKSEFQTSENKTSESRKNQLLNVGKTDSSKNKSSNNDKNNSFSNNNVISKYSNTATAGVEGHGNQVVVENKKTNRSISKGFDVDRFVNSPQVHLQIERLLEAERYSEKAKEKIQGAIKYFAESCNCFGIEKIKIINTFSDNEYRDLFNIAYGIKNKDFEYDNLINDKRYMSSEIKKCIANHAE